MRTKYHFDEFQRIYFVVEGFEELLRATEETDFASVYRKIASEAALEPEDAFPGDRAYHGPLQPVRPGPSFMNGEARPCSGRRRKATPTATTPKTGRAAGR